MRQEFSQPEAPTQLPVYEQTSREFTDNEAVCLDESLQDEQEGQLTAVTLEALLARETRARNMSSIRILLGSLGMWAGIQFMLPIMARSDGRTFGILIALCMTLLFGIGGLVCTSLMLRAYKGKRHLTEQIARISSKSNIGTLVRMLKVDGKAVNDLVQRILIDLLPQLNAGDAEMLGETERDILRRKLMVAPAELGYRDLTELRSKRVTQRETALRLAILKAFEQIGGQKELPIVAHIAGGDTAAAQVARKLGPARKLIRMPDEITRAAADCLPYLQARSELQVAGQQLLRASSANSAADQALLRAVTADTEEPADQLLRAVESRTADVAS